MKNRRENTTFPWEDRLSQWEGFEHGARAATARAMRGRTKHRDQKGFRRPVQNLWKNAEKLPALKRVLTKQPVRIKVEGGSWT